MAHRQQSITHIYAYTCAQWNYADTLRFVLHVCLMLAELLGSCMTCTHAHRNMELYRIFPEFKSTPNISRPPPPKHHHPKIQSCKKRKGPCIPLNLHECLWIWWPFSWLLYTETHMHAVCLPSIICLIAIFILVVVVFSAIFVKIPDYKSNPEHKSTPNSSNNFLCKKWSTYNREIRCTCIMVMLIVNGGTSMDFTEKYSKGGQSQHPCTKPEATRLAMIPDNTCFIRKWQVKEGGRGCTATQSVTYMYMPQIILGWGWTHTVSNQQAKYYFH